MSGKFFERCVDRGSSLGDSREPDGPGGTEAYQDALEARKARMRASAAKGTCILV